jgi:hypothetical protein
MNTSNATFVESPRNVAADTTKACRAASAERLESGPGFVRVSLFGFSIEVLETTGAMPVSILGC